MDAVSHFYKYQLDLKGGELQAESSLDVCVRSVHEVLYSVVRNFVLRKCHSQIRKILQHGFLIL